MYTIQILYGDGEVVDQFQVRGREFSITHAKKLLRQFAFEGKFIRILSSNNEIVWQETLP